VTFSAGSDVTVREVLSGQTWAEFSESVVHDDGGVLATFMREGTPLGFPEHPWPHPWAYLTAWQGTSVLKLRRPADWYSVWVFFVDHRFSSWYVNFEQPFVRRADGIDVNDLQLDLVIEADGSRRWKDVEDLGPCLASGRITLEELRHVLDAAALVTELLDRGDRWWAPWDDWVPTPS
jgi:Protein of unknown function (DUF402)